MSDDVVVEFTPDGNMGYDFSEVDEFAREAINLLKQVSDIANGASIYLGHNERIVKDIDEFLRMYHRAS